MQNKSKKLVVIIKNYFDVGIYDEENLKMLMKSNMITQEEYNSIIPTSGDILLDDIIDEEIDEVSL